ncbi:MAG: FtsX-like permease family protein [Bacteroidales bacterium]|nr:FtsX-like permease family protein [Bacteroidales bacterium]
MTKLPLKFAFRYLFARKSYNVINMISGIGVAGMAVGTAALIIILSVFNGFNRLVDSSLNDLHADLSVRPAEGKVFVPDSSAFAWAGEQEDVLSFYSVLEDQVFLSYDGKQCLSRVRGLDSVAEEEFPLQEHLVDGEWSLHNGSLPQAVVGAGVAYTLNLSPRFISPLEIHYPSRNEEVSLSNPTASLRSVSLRPSGIFSVNADVDARLVVVPIEVMRELLEYPDEVSSMELNVAPGSAFKVAKALQERLGDGFRVLDRYQQEESIYRMMRYEKLAIYLILVFIVLIIAFNIYSALKMLVIEKQGDIGTLRSMGAPEGLIRRIFLWEGWLVSLLGMVIGLVLGIVIVWLQDRFGLIAMPGNFVVQAYPVVLKATDILWTVVGVAGIGFLMALIPSRKL